MKNGFALIKKSWKKGDRIRLILPMPVMQVKASEEVTFDRGKTALQRGPLVYCLEWPDNPGGHILNLVLDKNQELTSSFNPALLNGVQIISGKASVATATKDGTQLGAPAGFTAIPYYSWANRGSGDMMVWIPSESSSARPVPMPTIASTSNVTASRLSKSLASVNDQELPISSSDRDVLYHHWWPLKDTMVWIQYDFSEPATISGASVYWFDDGPDGGCRIPKSWQILYRSGNKWLPVATYGKYPVMKDTLNTIRFKSVNTTAVRLEVTLQEEFSTGVYEWMLHE
jgi:hypothetical protein